MGEPLRPGAAHQVHQVPAAAADLPLACIGVAEGSHRGRSGSATAPALQAPADRSRCARRRTAPAGSAAAHGRSARGRARRRRSRARRHDNESPRMRRGSGVPNCDPPQQSADEARARPVGLTQCGRSRAGSWECARQVRNANQHPHGWHRRRGPGAMVVSSDARRGAGALSLSGWGEIWTGRQGRGPPLRLLERQVPLGSSAEPAAAVDGPATDPSRQVPGCRAREHDRAARVGWCSQLSQLQSSR